MMPSPQQASVSAGLETRNIGAAMAGIAMRSISLCTSARAISDFSTRRRRRGHAACLQLCALDLAIAQELAQHLIGVLAKIGRSAFDGDASAIEAVGQAFHQSTMFVTDQRDTGEVRVAQEIVAVVARRRGNAAGKQGGYRVRAVAGGTERTKLAVRLVERDG